MWHITSWPVLDHEHIIASFAERVDPDDELTLLVTRAASVPLPADVAPGTPDHLAWVAEQLLDMAYEGKHRAPQVDHR